MARGFPDWQDTKGLNRQGEYIPYFAEPPLWWFDDFNSPTFKWTQIGATVSHRAGSETGVANDVPWSGEGLMRLYSTTNNTAQAMVLLGAPTTETDLGIEIVMSYHSADDYTDSNTDHEVIKLDVYNGSTNIRVILTWNPATGNWYVTGPTAADVNLVGTVKSGGSAWSVVKLVFNLSDGYYKRLYVGNWSADISAYQLYAVGATTSNYSQISMKYKCIATEMYQYTNIGFVKVTYGET